MKIKILLGIEIEDFKTFTDEILHAMDLEQY